MSESSSRQPSWSLWLAPVVLVVLLGLLFKPLSVEWSVNEQYGYGWFVPLLALYLFAEAWLLRPEGKRPLGNVGWMGIALVLLFLWLPVRLVQEANPDWRPVGWALAGVTVGLLWCGLYARGGWPWWRQMAFATAFILTAVPWPTALEQTLVRGLMSTVAAASVECLTWLGVPARAMGNVIALPGQLVGVDEACSGVRSLQTVITAGLLMGEVYRLSWLRRLALLILAMGLAFVTNVARAALLVWLVAKSGAANLTPWHDPVGYAVLGVSLAGVWGLAVALRGRGRGVSSSMTQPKRSTGNWCELFAVDKRERALLISILIWLLAVEAATEGWYRWHERSLQPTAPWSVTLPSGEKLFKPVTLNETESRLLRVNRVSAGAWLTPQGEEVVTYFLRWEPGRSAAQLARLHRPEICLPSAGCFLLRDEGVWNVSVGEVMLPLRQLVFDFNGSPLYVFYCLTEDRVLSSGHSAAETLEDWSVRSRLEAVAVGRRNQGQQVLEVIVRGPRDATHARAAMERLLPGMILIRDQPAR